MCARGSCTCCASSLLLSAAAAAAATAATVRSARSSASIDSSASHMIGSLIADAPSARVAGGLRATFWQNDVQTCANVCKQILRAHNLSRCITAAATSIALISAPDTHSTAQRSMFLFIAVNPLCPPPCTHRLPLRSKPPRRVVAPRPSRPSRPSRVRMQSNSSPWPLARFINTALFYSPLRRFFAAPKSDPAARLRVRARKLAKSLERPVYLVTGANGGSGRRVVRNLLRHNIKVRALTRDRDKLIDALLMVGVDALEQEKQGNLHIFVSDLYNIRQELFHNVVAIASCTGTRVGPRDDPDRSKYFQGVKFYSPLVLDDTPENVEYRGIKNLMEAARKHFDAINKVDTLPVLEFTDINTVSSQWGALDDVVMGGVSETKFSVTNGQLIFSGFVSTDNRGGFTSLRTVTFDTAMDLSAYHGIDLRVKGDGQSYKLIIRCDRNWDGISHCYTFPTVSAVWEEVRVPFSEFNTVFRAKTLSKGKPLDPKRIFAFQIMLSKFEYDGELNQNFKPGPFQLCISSISAYTEQENAQCPKVVHIGSAATTRPLRTNEQFEDVPPAVKLNEQLGLLLNWKLAGEDAVRVSGVPYCILRPTALTEEEPVGLNRLVFDQGDNIMGRVGRDDVADLILKAFSTPQLTNVTAEVTIAEDNVQSLGDADERLKQLKADEEQSRSFAPFPYVPEIKPSEKTAV
eukprot:TRINITY_DN438_c0_g1_i1.p1 TRINITY_DN438_c0_g1~~TRINITY_DN438_c0_g1_i1.p1  ORF type:complete len:690 (-),score=149.15 TRINITY_DN438_c0_g1_i1:7706-9775(-)